MPMRTPPGDPQAAFLISCPRSTSHSRPKLYRRTARRIPPGRLPGVFRASVLSSDSPRAISACLSSHSGLGSPGWTSLRPDTAASSLRSVECGKYSICIHPLLCWTRKFGVRTCSLCDERPSAGGASKWQRLTVASHADAKHRMERMSRYRGFVVALEDNKNAVPLSGTA